MKRDWNRSRTAVVSGFVLLAMAVTFAPAPAAAQMGAAPAAEVAVEPAAIAALEQMGAYLRTLKAYQVEAATSREEVLESGLKAQFANVTTILVRMPDRLFAETVGDRQQRQYYYNGKEFTLYARRLTYYATVAAPATVKELATTVDDKYGIEIPLVDLLLWGADGASSAGITAAVDLGASAIDGVTCTHYAFRQEGLDWQIWIQKGDFPLPKRLVLTTTTDEARPQFTANYTWNLAPSFNDDAFTFDPPADAKRIVFEEAAAASK